MDIVERLRSPEVLICTSGLISPVAFEAAEEIERLRKDKERLRYALEWIASCEGGDIFEIWKKMRKRATQALKRKEGE